MWYSVLTIGHHGKWSVQMYWQSTISQAQVSGSTCFGNDLTLFLVQIRQRLYHLTQNVGNEKQSWTSSRIHSNELPASNVKSKYVHFTKRMFQYQLVCPQAHHHTILEFNIPNADTCLSNIFSVLQKAHKLLKLQDYSVSQTTLDQVRNLELFEWIQCNSCLSGFRKLCKSSNEWSRFLSSFITEHWIQTKR